MGGDRYSNDAVVVLKVSDTGHVGQPGSLW